ncbi:hypothetical protein NFI96_028806, partial [Prochilodus magdalenae]
SDAPQLHGEPRAHTMKTLRALAFIFMNLSASTGYSFFPFGPPAGDASLQKGDDEVSRPLKLRRPLQFYDTQFNVVYVSTNGLLSSQPPPEEGQYLRSRFPLNFPAIAPFLVDVDTTVGNGAVYYRSDESLNALTRAAQIVQQGFSGAQFRPTHLVIATWDQVSCFREDPVEGHWVRAATVSSFQLVLAGNKTDTFALFLYAEDTPQFSENADDITDSAAELRVLTGFSRGDTSITEELYYSVTTSQEATRTLFQLFLYAQRFSVFSGSGDVLHCRGWNTCGSAVPQRGTLNGPGVVCRQRGEPAHPCSCKPLGMNPTGLFSNPYLAWAEFQNLEWISPHIPTRVGASGTGLRFEARQEGNSGVRGLWIFHVGSSRFPFQKVVGVTEPQTEDTGEPVTTATSQDLSIPEAVTGPPSPVSGGAQTSASPGNASLCGSVLQDCSSDGFCKDYPRGPCCHCRSGYYGNGRQCLPMGVTQRLNGQLSGHVSVGSAAVLLDRVDVHGYAVPGEGRVYISISPVPPLAGWALTAIGPLLSVLGWLFALELHSHQNGFSITGAELSHLAEMTFYPGNQHLNITQQARGLDSPNHLRMEMHISGNLPSIPSGAKVQVPPYKETLHYNQSVITSSGLHQYMVVSENGGSETFSYLLHQKISFQRCEYRPLTVPDFQQLSVEHVMVMYTSEGSMLKYAVTTSVGPVGGELPELVELNPCGSGKHYCDPMALCLPGEGLQYHCQCAMGFRGDGRNCYATTASVKRATSSTSTGESAWVSLQHTPHRGLKERGGGAAWVSLQHTPHRGLKERGGGAAWVSLQHTPHRGLKERGGGAAWVSLQHTPHRGLKERGGGAAWVSLQHRPHRELKERGGGAAWVSLQHRPHRELKERGGGAAWVSLQHRQHRELKERGGGAAWVSLQHRQHRELNERGGGAAWVSLQHRQHRELKERGGGAAWVSLQHTPRRGLKERGGGAAWVSLQHRQHRELKERGGGAAWVSLQHTPHRELKERGGGAAWVSLQHTPHRELKERGGGAAWVNIDECLLKLCHPLASCSNTLGSFHCRCWPGYEGDGFLCQTQKQAGAVESVCERHRDSLLGGLQGWGSDATLQDYAPHCDEQGQYKPLQCLGSTGHCWCVDSRGQERVGTRTLPGTPHANCDQPAPLVPRAETLCERWRTTLLSHYGGRPDPQDYMPQCDARGHFLSVQCYGNSSYCWCVDAQGREVTGTRSHDPVQPPCTSLQTHLYIQVSSGELSQTQVSFVPTGVSAVPPVAQPWARPVVTSSPSGPALLATHGSGIRVLPLDGAQPVWEKASMLLSLQIHHRLQSVHHGQSEHAGTAAVPGPQGKYEQR